MVFFFFKQKTAYGMRISDWSSDVCSSDLAERTEHICDLLQTLARIGKTIGTAAASAHDQIDLILDAREIGADFVRYLGHQRSARPMYTATARVELAGIRQQIGRAHV